MSLEPITDDAELDKHVTLVKHTLGAGFWALILITVSLVIGMTGYMVLEGLPAINAFENASMILSGMGPVDEMKTLWGKLFAGFYALYSGVAVLAASGILLAPWFRHTLHNYIKDADFD